MNYPDIYFEPFWGKLNAVLETDGEYEQFVFTNEKGCVYYHFILRPAEPLIDGTRYFDSITPYGFNGPIVIEAAEGRREALVADFNEAFDAFCARRRIIAEYVRFCPWLENHKDFADLYALRYNGKTYGVDLRGDFARDELSTNVRRGARRAKVHGVEVVFDCDGRSVAEFMRLYAMTFDKTQMTDYYRFSPEFIADLIAACGDKAMFANAVYKGKIISSAICLISDRYMHGHLLGNDYNYIKLYTNALLYAETFNWAAAHGKEFFHMGGATTENLIRYKEQYTKNGRFDYYIGTKVRDQAVYDRLVRMKGTTNTDYFPAYR